MKEKFKDVSMFNGSYKISNFGRIFSNFSNKILTPRKDRMGYFYINLRLNNKSYSKKIHRLVAEAFIKNPEDKPQVNHIDGVKTNNYFYNLEWCTSSENRIHAYKIGIQKPVYGENRSDSKLKNYQIEEIKELYKSGKFTQKEISFKYNVSPTTISDVINIKKYKNI